MGHRGALPFTSPPSSMLELSHIVLVALLLVASVTDIRQGRIFNWITYPGLVAGLLFGAIQLTEAGRLNSTRPA